MDYMTKTIKYMFRNIHKLLVFIIVPAIFLGLSTNMYGIIDDIVLLGNKDSVSIMKIYSNISMLGSESWYFMIAGVVLTAFFNSSVIPIMDRHMRIGKFSFKFYKYFNEILLICLPIIVIYLVLNEILAFLTASIIGLFGIFIPIAGMGIAATILLIIMFFVWLVIFTFLTNWLPCCMVKGYRKIDGVTTSASSVSKCFWRILFSILIPIVCLLAVSIVAALYLGSYAVLVYIVCYALFLMYVDVFCMTAFFEINEYERKDIKYSIFLQR